MNGWCDSPELYVDLRFQVRISARKHTLWIQTVDWIVIGLIQQHSPIGSSRSTIRHWL